MRVARGLGMTLVLLVLGVAAACRPVTPGAELASAQKTYDTYGQALVVAVDVYTVTLQSIGEAHARGQISDEQLDAKIRPVSRQVYSALVSTRAALDAYLTLGPDANVSGLADQVMTLQRLVLELVRAAREAGISS